MKYKKQKKIYDKKHGCLKAPLYPNYPAGGNSGISRKLNFSKQFIRNTYLAANFCFQKRKENTHTVIYVFKMALYH